MTLWFERRYGEYRQDRCLLTFGMIEMFLMPGSFLAGCYGMNFEDDEGRSAWWFLGLDHWYSYPAWWLIVLVIAFLMYTYFKVKRIL